MFFLIWTTELHPSQNTRVPVVVFLVLVSVDPQHKQTVVITNRLLFVIFKGNAFGFIMLHMQKKEGYLAGLAGSFWDSYSPASSMSSTSTVFLPAWMA